MPLPPLNPWVQRGLCLLIGYCAKVWLENTQRAAPGSESDEEEQQLPQRHRQRRVRPAAPPPPGEELKMVLVVNDELKMGKGKIGAQCAHAAVGAVEELTASGQGVLLAAWEHCGQPKICLRGSTTAELRELGASARARGLPIYIVQDAGRTQVAPGSRTVLAIGPGPRSQVDAVTGNLRLL